LELPSETLPPLSGVLVRFLEVTAVAAKKDGAPAADQAAMAKVAVSLLRPSSWI